MIETLQALSAGFANALTLPHLLWALAASPWARRLTVAVLLPITFNLDPISAFIMFGGIDYGAMYGWSTTSILLNTPGETGSIATPVDGYVMGREGRGSTARRRGSSISADGSSHVCTPPRPGGRCMVRYRRSRT